MGGKGWTPEEDTLLLDIVKLFLGDGNLIKNAFKYYAAEQGRTYEATRRRYFDIKGEDAPDLRLREPGVNPKPKLPRFEAPPVKNNIHSSLQGVSAHIESLEAQNEGLRSTIDYLQKENQLLNARIAEAEKCEAELNHLLTIINRSRKEAFAGDAAPKKYKVIDGVPVFE